MADIYTSLIRNLASSEPALKTLKQCGAVAGIETVELNETAGKISQSGLKYGIHDPHLSGMNNLGDPELASLYESAANQSLLNVIRYADAPVVGFHCGFAARQVYKMRAFSDIPVPGTFHENEEVLFQVMLTNLQRIENEINRTGLGAPRKTVLIETMDYIRPQKVDWNMQSPETLSRKTEIEDTISRFGVNASYRYVHELAFLRRLLTSLTPGENHSFGFLFDISHNFITADALIHEKKIEGTIEDYFESVIQSVGNQTRQIHVNVPSGDPYQGYLDHHRPFTPGNVLSDRILELTRFVVSNSPGLEVVTLEMYADATPENFASLMAAQAEYFLKRIPC